MLVSRKAVVLLLLVLAASIAVNLWLAGGAGRPVKTEGAGSTSPALDISAATHRSMAAASESHLGHLTSYQPAESLSAELFEVNRLAESGDAQAMRRVGEILSDCHPVIMAGARFVPQAVSDAKAMGLSAADTARTEQLALRLSESCAGVEGGRPYPSNLAELSFREAAAAGDLAALVTVAGLESALESEARVNELATLAARSKDVAALLALYNHLPPNSFLSIDGVDAPVSPSALVIHACRSSQLACGPTSRYVVSSCLMSFQCNANSMEEIIRRYHLTPAQAERLPAELRSLEG